MKIGIIADDLTGANATGVKLAKLGFDAITSLTDTPITLNAEKSVVCIDTNSRYAQSACARQSVNQAIQQLQSWDVDVICKRIDSTFRGNIGAEIDTLLTHLPDAVGVIVPAYPNNQRTVLGGYMLVNGIPLQETDVANDPVRPLTDSNLPNILKTQTKNIFELIDMETITIGQYAIKEQMKHSIQNGTRLFICDACTEKHIQSIAQAMDCIKTVPFIPIDPGPLTTYYLEKLHHPREGTSDTVLVSVGSTTKLTGEQIAYLVDKTKATPVLVDPEQLISSKSRNSLISKVTEKALNNMEKSNVIIITTNHPEQLTINIEKVATMEGINVNEAAKKITSGLAEISKQILRHAGQDIAGCFFSGGDAISSFCEAVNASGFQLIDEVMPLTAYGKITDGEFDGLPVVSKGGLVGEQAAIYNSIMYLTNTQKQEASK